MESFHQVSLFLVIVAEVHIDVVISFFLYLVSLSGFSLSVSVVVAAVVVVGFENHNVFDVCFKQQLAHFSLTFFKH